jgi:glutathione S-transferase
MITLYSFPKTRGRRVTWMMEELGENYEFKLIPSGEKGFKSDVFLKINPAGKVPAIQDGELVLTESAAIVTYLGDKFPNKGLVPAAGTTERGKYNQWSYFALTELEQPLWTIGKHKFALPEDKRIPAIFDTAAWEFQQALKILDKGMVDNNYILGDSFSAADILICHTLNWGTNFGQPIEQVKLKAYQERVSSRDALQRAIFREESVQK